MTLDEAYVFLSLQQEDDLMEIYEEQLFSYKNFFTSKPVIWTTFNSKLTKLARTKEAFETLGVKLDNLQGEIESFQLIESEIISEVFNDFQAKKNKIYLSIHRSTSIDELKFYVLQLLELSHTYSSHWPDIKNEVNTVLISKETDPMELHSEIKIMKEKGVITFDNLKNDKNLEINSVKKESLRLYLLHQKELEWKRSLPN